jgi:hypothetical protein
VRAPGDGKIYLSNHRTRTDDREVVRWTPAENLQRILPTWFVADLHGVGARLRRPRAYHLESTCSLRLGIAEPTALGLEADQAGATIAIGGAGFAIGATTPLIVDLAFALQAHPGRVAHGPTGPTIQGVIPEIDAEAAAKRVCRGAGAAADTANAFDTRRTNKAAAATIERVRMQTGTVAAAIGPRPSGRTLRGRRRGDNIVNEGIAGTAQPVVSVVNLFAVVDTVAVRVGDVGSGAIDQGERR